MENQPTPQVNVEAASQLPPVKPGSQSSEFILALIVVILAAAGIVSGKVPPEWGVPLSGILVIAHARLRTGLKERHLDLASDIIEKGLSAQKFSMFDRLITGGKTFEKSTPNAAPVAPENLSFAGPQA